MTACSHPYFIENQRFQRQLEKALPRRTELCQQWSIPDDAICFVFAGKLQPKKRPMDLLHALVALAKDSSQGDTGVPPDKPTEPTVQHHSKGDEPNCQLPTAN